MYLYDNDDLLGEGCYSKVYKGYKLDTFEEIAIKMINLTDLVNKNGKEIIKYFGNEVNLL